MKNLNVAIPDETHARLREYAWQTRMTMGDALRFALDHCLPALPSKTKPTHPEVGKADDEAAA